ncbi:hypothetical protein ACSKOA_004176 [Salmonella enterica]|nr:hypothetical protein [Enterobacter cloacae]
MDKAKINDELAAAPQRKPGTISPRVFFGGFLLGGIVGLGLSLMYDYKAMQAVSVAAMCIGFYYLVTKRAK